MRILLDYRPALRQRTGVGEYIHEMARAVAVRAPVGDDLALFSSSWKDRLAAGVVPGARTVDCRVPVRVLNWLWHRHKWPPVERLTGEAFDVVQAAHPLLIPTRRAATIVTVHDLDFLDHPERTRAEIRRDYPARAADHARRADRVIVVSKDTARQVERRLGVDADRISICPPGAPDWTRRPEEPGRDGTILFLGTLEPRKNVGTLLDAYARVLARLPHAPSLVLAGGAAPGAAPLIERTRRAPLAGHVETLGYVDEATKRALFERALLFVLPSHLEGFGLSALEALTVGVPVVATNRGALPDTVGDAGRLVDADDPDALAAAMIDVLTNVDLRRRMRDSGWAHAQTFTWARTADATREAWALAVAHRRHAHG